MNSKIAIFRGISARFMSNFVIVDSRSNRFQGTDHFYLLQTYTRISVPANIESKGKLLKGL